MPSDPAVIADRPAFPASARPSFLALRDRPDAIHRLRVFIGAAIFGLPYAADEVELVAAELVTNAIRAVRRLTIGDDLWPIGVEMTATYRYVYLAVTDLDHQPIAGVDRAGQLAENGRGLSIVDQLVAARWVVYAEHGKTVNVLMVAPGVELTAVELEQIGAPA